MTAIKSYTDIEQSCKLAEILPVESADMRYAPFGDTHPWVWNEEVKLLEKGSVPCWSLAALLNVLPPIYNLKPILDLEENSIQYSGIDIYVKADNPVDACYEVILKLHELKKL